MAKTIYIDKQPIGKTYPPYIIAELSANHNGSLERALQSLDMIKQAGANAAKIQTYTADTMTLDSSKADFQINHGLWKGYNLYQLYQQAHTPYEWHQALFTKAKAIDLTLFSSPFDETAIDFLEDLGAPAYKIASFEAIDLPLIAYAANTGKPLIISTGMANLKEIEEAVVTAQSNGCNDLILLHCISAYPAPIEQANLATIKDLAQRFDCQVGLSDHSMGTTLPVVATTLGASIIEKHVTLSREDEGPDSAFSLEPDELSSLCQMTKAAHSSIGQVNYKRTGAEAENLRFRRSIYFVKTIKAGEYIQAKDIRRIRPGFGLAPKHFDQLIGRKVTQDIEAGTATAWELLEEAGTI